MANSPWGEIQESEQVKRGVRIISGSRSCGMLFTQRAAEKYLSDAAIDAGTKWGDYIAYEGTSLGVVVLDNPGFLEAIYGDVARTDPASVLRRAFEKTLRDHPEYLLSHAESDEERFSMCLGIMEHREDAMLFMPPQYITDDVAIPFIKKTGRGFLYIRSALMTKGMCEAAVESNPSTLTAVPEKFLTCLNFWGGQKCATMSLIDWWGWGCPARRQKCQR